MPFYEYYQEQTETATQGLDQIGKAWVDELYGVVGFSRCF